MKVEKKNKTTIVRVSLPMPVKGMRDLKNFLQENKNSRIAIDPIYGRNLTVQQSASAISDYISLQIYAKDNGCKLNRIMQPSVQEINSNFWYGDKSESYFYASSKEEALSLELHRALKIQSERNQAWN